MILDQHDQLKDHQMSEQTVNLDKTQKSEPHELGCNYLFIDQVVGLYEEFSLDVTYQMQRSQCSMNAMPNIFVPDQVGTLAQDETSSNIGWPIKVLTTISLLKPNILHLGKA